jgi:hypothetical protein
MPQGENDSPQPCWSDNGFPCRRARDRRQAHTSAQEAIKEAGLSDEAKAAALIAINRVASILSVASIKPQTVMDAKKVGSQRRLYYSAFQMPIQAAAES